MGQCWNMQLKLGDGSSTSRRGGEFVGSAIVVVVEEWRRVEVQGWQLDKRQ